MCEWWDYSRGFCGKLARHKIDLNFTGKSRGLNTKQGVFFHLWTGTYRKGHGLHGLQELLGVSNRRGSRQLGVWGRCKTERGDRGDRDDVLTSVGDGREQPDFREGRRWSTMVVGTVPLGRRCSGARLATGISGGDAARSRGPHDGLGFLQSAPWPADQGRPEAVVFGSGELRG
jgi:hypothetical protein